MYRVVKLKKQYKKIYQKASQTIDLIYFNTAFPA